MGPRLWRPELTTFCDPPILLRTAVNTGTPLTMESRTDFSLQSLNTFGVEAAAAHYVRFDDGQEIARFLARQPAVDRRCLVLGGGSNILFVKDFNGLVLHPQLKGIEVLEMNEAAVRIKVMGGENWDDLVAYAVAHGWGGLENLSLIPGSVGASAVQNIGAYGVEVKDVIERVEAVDLDSLETVSHAGHTCGFGYRHSHFKGSWFGRYMITAVVFRLSRRPRFVIDYPGVREALQPHGPITLESLRQAIIAIRQAKLPDPACVGNAGSFFKNPVVDGATLDRMLGRFPDLPHYPQPDGYAKVPAGWMIEHCGWKGRRVGRAGVHDRQALVLVNLGGATGRDIFDLSEQIRVSVYDTFGIDLEREVLVLR